MLHSGRSVQLVLSERLLILMLAICNADRKSININVCQRSQFIVTKHHLVC